MNGRLSNGVDLPLFGPIEVGLTGLPPELVEQTRLAVVISNNATELSAKSQRRQVLADQYASEHALGEGGLVLANEFGGIDPGQPEATSEHLVARAVIAHNTGLHATDDIVEAGLLHPTIARLMGEDFQEYMSAVRTLLNSFALLPHRAIRQAHGPAIVESAVMKSREFVEVQSGALLLAAHAHPL